MIAALVLAIAASPEIIEFAEPNSPFVTFQAVVKLPKHSSEEHGALRIAAESLQQGSKDHPASSIFELGLTGERFAATLAADHLRVSLTVEKGSANLAAKAFASVLIAPRLDDETLENLTARVPFRYRDYWETALDPWLGTFANLKPPANRESYARFIRPEKTTIVIGGSIKPGELRQVLIEATTQWPPEPKTRRRVPAPISEVAKHEKPITTLEFRGPPITDFPRELAACIVLGSGKGSVLYQTVREGLGASYRQEAFIASTPEGLRVRLIMATPEAPETIKKALLAEISKIRQQDLDRVLGILTSLALRGFEMSPLYFGATRQLNNELADRMYLSAYFGEQFDWDAIIAATKAIKPVDLQTSCRTMIEAAQPIVIRG